MPRFDDICIRAHARATAWLLFVALGVLVPGVTHAQPSDDQIGELSTFFELFPELRTLPAPEVVAPAIRVSYSASGATSGSGGAGVIQYDVVSMSPTTVMLNQQNFGDGGAGVIPLGQTVARGRPGLGPFWINPRVLTNAERVASPTLTVTRYDKQVAGSTRSVVRFQTQTSTGRTVYEFSAASGLLVFSSTSSSGGAAQLELLSLRTLQLPWPDDAAPRWARPGTRLDFTGSRTTQVNGANTVTQQMQVSMSISDATNQWSVFDAAIALENVGQSSNQTVAGIAQLDAAIWLPLGALAANLPNASTMVDRDPITGAQVFVSTDTDAIIVHRELPASTTTWIYDDSLGVLDQQVDRVQTPQSFVETVLSRTGGSNLSELAELPPLPDEGGSGGADANADEQGCSTSHGPPLPAALVLGLLGVAALRRSPLDTTIRAFYKLAPVFGICRRSSDW